MQLIFKCSHCTTIIFEKRKYVGFNSITLPDECPNCGSELRDIESVNVIEPRLGRAISSNIYSSSTNTTTSTTTSSSSSIDDNIDDADYTDHTYPAIYDELILRFNVPEYAIPYVQSTLKSKAAHRGKFYSLSKTREKLIFNKILILSRMLAVKKQTVLLETFNIVNDIIRKTKQHTTTELDKLIAVTLYLVAHSHGISADKQLVLDIVKNKKEYKKIHRIIAPRLKFSRSTLITVFVSELASELQMNEKLYAMTLQLALQLSRAILDIRQAAAIAAYITYNAHALVNKKKTVSFKQLDITPRMFSRIKKIEIMLV